MITARIGPAWVCTTLGHPTTTKFPSPEEPESAPLVLVMDAATLEKAENRAHFRHFSSAVYYTTPDAELVSISAVCTALKTCPYTL